MYAYMLTETKLVAILYGNGDSDLKYTTNFDLLEDENMFLKSLKKHSIKLTDTDSYNSWEGGELTDLEGENSFFSWGVDSYIYVLLQYKDGSSCLHIIETLKIPVDPDDYDEEEYEELDEDDKYEELSVSELDSDKISTYLDNLQEQNNNILRYNFWYGYDVEEL